MPVISALSRLGHECHGFKASLGCITSLAQKNKKESRRANKAVTVTSELCAVTSQSFGTKVVWEQKTAILTLKNGFFRQYSSFPLRLFLIACCFPLPGRLEEVVSHMDIILSQVFAV